MSSPGDHAVPGQETLLYPRSAPSDRIGRYQLLERIGGGGMGVVYKARHLALQRTVALKLLHPHKEHLEHLAARFWREMEAAGKLDHPNIVRATDAGQEGETLFLAMELIEGIDLDKLVQLHPPLSVPQVCELIRQTALGLEAIRRARIVHRDIKPSNLMLSTEGVVKILDVGLALFRDEETKAELTPAGATLGTADYLAPEQAGDSKHVDIRSDIYSLGCTMYKLLAGHAPFQDSKHLSWGSKLTAHLFEAPPPIEERTDIPTEVHAILAKMTAKSRVARYQTPAEIVEALAPWSKPDLLPLVNERSMASAATAARSEMETPHAKGSTLTISSQRPEKRGRRWVLAGSLSLVAAAMVGAVAWSSWPKHDPPQPTAKGTDENPTRLVPKTEPAKEPLPDLDDVQRVGWRNLLDRPPKPLLWKVGDGVATYQFDDSLQQLNVIGDSPSLLAFGKTESPCYTLQVGFAQPRWTAGAGVFWGYRLIDETRRSAKKLPSEYVASFQYLRFETRRDSGKGELFSLARGIAYVVQDGSGRAKTFRHAAAIVEISSPEGEQILEVVVDRNQLRRVRFGSRDLEGLVRPDANEKFEPEDYHGPLGTYTFNASCVYRNVRFVKHD